MKPKVLEKERAVDLRKKGYSLNEISLKLGISKSTAFAWLKKVPLSKEGRARMDRRRAEGARKSRVTRMNRTAKRLDEALQAAQSTIAKIPRNKDISRLQCSLLYWCEGEKSKNDSSLIFTNSDPLLVKAFLKHLRNGYDLDESKFRVCVHLHSYHDEQKQLIFWSKLTTIPLEQFIKPYHKANSGKNIRLGYAGCASVRYYDVRIARRVQAIAKAFLQQ